MSQQSSDSSNNVVFINILVQYREIPVNLRIQPSFRLSNLF